MQYFMNPIKQYAQFTGRATRQEFWMWVLWILGISIVLAIIDLVAGTNIDIGGTPEMPVKQGILGGAFNLFILIPGISMAVRRLHDTGKSGAWWFLNFVCVIGTVVLIVFYATSSSPEDNQYGPNPHS